MRKQLIVLLPFLLLPFLAGCLMTRAQVKEQETRKESQSQQVAMQQAHYQDLEEQLRAANGRIETLENSIDILKNEKRNAEKSHDTDRKELENKLKVYEEALSKMETQYLSLSQKLEAVQATAAAAKDKDSGKKGGAKNFFDQGEEDFKKKNYKQAIANYQSYREANGKGKNYAEATYKMGVSFQELGMKDDALPFFNEVVEKYPKSKSADKAKIRLKQLK